MVRLEDRLSGDIRRVELIATDVRGRIDKLTDHLAYQGVVRLGDAGKFAIGDFENRVAGSLSGVTSLSLICSAPAQSLPMVRRFSRMACPISAVVFMFVAMRKLPIA